MNITGVKAERTTATIVKSTMKFKIRNEFTIPQ